MPYFFQFLLLGICFIIHFTWYIIICCEWHIDDEVIFFIDLITISDPIPLYFFVSACTAKIQRIDVSLASLICFYWCLYHFHDVSITLHLHISQRIWCSVGLILFLYELNCIGKIRLSSQMIVRVAWILKVTNNFDCEGLNTFSKIQFKLCLNYSVRFLCIFHHF